MTTALRRLRTPLLVLAGLVVAHDAVFASDRGVAALATTLAASGHGLTWELMSLAALAGALMVAAAFSLRMRALRREARALARLAPSSVLTLAHGFGTPSSYVTELRRLWPRLFLAVAVGFLVQENIEALIGHGGPGGLEPLLAAHPLGLLVLAGVTLAFAAVGALLRGQAAALERLVARLRQELPRAALGTNARPRPAAVVARNAISLRPDAGRAPPAHAASVSA